MLHAFKRNSISAAKGPARTAGAITRRRFMRTMLLGAAAPMIVPARVLGRGGATAPSNRINVAALGLGFGWRMFLGHEQTQFRAVCDVQADRLARAKRTVDAHYENKDCSTHGDFREVLARRDIDAVYIASPDHWHSLMTIAAAQAGKHVYCQKPLTRTIAEGQAVVEAVRRHGIVFQHGTQQRHDAAMLFGCELVRNGYIGKLKHVRIASPAGLTCAPQPTEPVPAGLDWDRWLGPAPWSDFTPLRIRAHCWYHISDYTMGYFAGWGVHHADSAQQASGLDHPDGPITVEADGIFPTGGLYDRPYRWQMHFSFANGLTWHWTDCSGNWGGIGEQTPPPAPWPQHRMGITLEGTEGTVFIWRGRVEADPPSLLHLRIGPRDKVRLVRPNGENIPDFIECIRRNHPTCAPVEIAHRSTTLCSLAAIAMQLRRKVVWDPRGEAFMGDEDANRLRSRAMREPWMI